MFSDKAAFQILGSIASIIAGALVMSFGVPLGFLLIFFGALGFAVLPLAQTACVQPVYIELNQQIPERQGRSETREIVLRDQHGRSIGMRHEQSSWSVK